MYALRLRIAITMHYLLHVLSPFLLVFLECDSKEAVTQAYLVRGLGAQFHCPCTDCVWQAAHFPGYNRSNSYFITNATSDLNGKCLPCEDGKTGKFTLFNITVDEQSTCVYMI